MIAMPAFAQQQTGSNDIQEVVVSGFRASQQKALDSKRESDLPIESIAPEDIGKMPDQNVAEALQRLPGIQIGRDSSGEGTRVLIDGLRQNLTTLNGDVFLSGKEFYVSGENSGGGSGAGAQYGSLEGIPSEEIGGIDVYKNPKASMTEGGLGGTIDLKTRNPLDQKLGLSLAGNFKMGTNEGQGDWTPVGTVVSSYKFNDRLAVIASFSYDDEKTKTNEFEAANRSGWLITNSATPPYVGALTPAGITTLPRNQFYIDPQLAYFSDIEDERKTYGASFGVAAKLTDSIRTSVNWFYSHEDDVNIDYSNKAGFNGSGQGPGAQIPGIDPTQPYAIDANGVVENGTFASTGAETATLYQHNISQSNNIQWRTDYDGGGPLHGSLDASYAYSTSDLEAAQADVEHGFYSAFSGAPTTPTAPGCNNFAPTCTNATGNHGYVFNWTNGGTSGLPTINYPTNVLDDPTTTLFKSNWAWANLTSQQQLAVKADVQYDLSFIKAVDTTLSGGFRYGSRDVNQTFGRYLINGVDASGKALANCCQDPNGGTWIYYSDPGYANIPFSTATSNPGLVKTVNIKGVGNVIVKDPGTLSNPSTYLNSVWNGAGVPNNTERFFPDALSSFNVEEKTYAGYLMGDMGSSANRFHINYGVRFIQTDLTIHNGQSAAVPTYYGTASWNGVDSNVVGVTTNRSYTDVLPSLNFVLDASQDEKVRFGAARVVSPQDLFALGAGNLYNFSRETNGRTNVHTGVKDGFAFFNGTSGNTQLDPYRASQFNLDYENYFSKSGLISIGGFYKQVDNFVETQNIPTFVVDDFGGTTNNVSKPINAGKGKIYGIEIGGQYAFDGQINPWLDGFGIAANYTRSMSVSEQPTSFQAEGPIPGVSKNAVTATLYYEKNGFSARGSYSWRDVSISDGGYGSSFSFNDQNGVSKTYSIYQAPYGQLDAQIGYDINEHFGVVFSVQNLTDEVQHTYLQWPNLPFTYDDSGRRFFLGGKFKL
jgi:TonB-dependent receptor